MSKLLPIIAAIILIVFVFWRLSTPTVPVTIYDQPDIILFYGETCPHCKVVEKYITDNKVDTKFKINYKEVYNNAANQKELESTVKNCPEIDASKGVGVPFAYFVKDKKCVIGDQPIIELLK